MINGVLITRQRDTWLQTQRNQAFSNAELTSVSEEMFFYQTVGSHLGSVTRCNFCSFHNASYCWLNRNRGTPKSCLAPFSQFSTWCQFVCWYELVRTLRKPQVSAFLFERCTLYPGEVRSSCTHMLSFFLHTSRPNVSPECRKNSHFWIQILNAFVTLSKAWRWYKQLTRVHFGLKITILNLLRVYSIVSLDEFWTALNVK